MPCPCNNASFNPRCHEQLLLEAAAKMVVCPFTWVATAASSQCGCLPGFARKFGKPINGHEGYERTWVLFGACLGLGGFRSSSACKRGPLAEGHEKRYQVLIGTVCGSVQRLDG
jgi:hypothetical protein